MEIKEKLEIQRKALLTARDKITDEISKIDEQSWKYTVAEAKENIGRCFIYKNCYSCPENDGDYWNEYYKVTGINKDEQYEIFNFSDTGKYKEIHFRKEIDSIGYPKFTMYSGYTEISEQEFNDALNIVHEKILKQFNELKNKRLK